MSNISDMLCAGYAIILVSCMWALYCNGRTYQQRLALIDAAFKTEEPRGWFLAVSYDDHFYALICFRDAYRLYDERLIAAVHKAKP